MLEFQQHEIEAYYRARLPKLNQRGKDWRGACPIHGGKDLNFSVDANTGRWFCHSTCQRGGDIPELEQAITHHVNFPEAVAEINRIIGRYEPPFTPPGGSRINGKSHKSEPPKPTKPGSVSFDSATRVNIQNLGAVSDSVSEPPASKASLREVEDYSYFDRDGKLVFEVVRYAGPNGQKTFRPRRPDGNGGWIWNLQGVDRVPYRLPELLAAKDKTIFLPEGEKDVHTLEAWGFLASCNPGGSGNSALYGEWTEHFRDRHVVILPDNDLPGKRHAIAKATSLLLVAKTIRVVELPVEEKCDVTDWKEAGGTRDEFLKILKASPVLDRDKLDELSVRWGLADTDTTEEEARQSAPETESTIHEQWPTPELIQSELPPVQAFSVDLLPDSFRPLVVDVAERMQSPMDYSAVVMVLCLAGAVNRRAVIQPKANDTGWTEPANLWGAIVGPPGVMKTPVIQAITSPLVQIQAEWRQEYEGAIAEHARLIEEHELTKSAWKEQFKAAQKAGRSAPERPADAPESPKLRRLTVNDSTFEALHQTMSENSSGVLLLRDEIVGWLAGLDRAGHETERAFCLEAWNGKNPYTVDRIGRGTIHVPACCMSLLGGIQPGRLRSYLADALEDGPSNDGLMQRFQLAVWPDLDNWEYVDREPNAAAEEQAARVLRKLVELDAENPARFRFSSEAQGLFIEWLSELEVKIRGDELHPALCAHLSKYRKLMPVLALLFELADRASSVGFVGSVLVNSENLVSLKHTQQAAAWCEYLESHARRIYSCVTTPQLRAASELAAKIKHRKVGTDGVFSCRDVYRQGWSGLDSPEAVKLAAEVLQDAGWLRELPGESNRSGGRPSNRYEVNPRVWE
jgi:hypothetical protein